MANTYFQAATKISYVDSIVRNLKTFPMYYGFLPYHGFRLLAVGDANLKDYYTMKGDIRNFILRRKRYLDGLEAAEMNGYVRLTVNHRHVLFMPVGNTTIINTNGAAGGDLLYWDSGSSTVKPASSFTWTTNLLTTQQNFAQVFVGVALDAHASGDGAKLLRVDTSPNSYFDFAAVSATHQAGDTFGPAKAAGNALLSNTLDEAVGYASIARCARSDTGATANTLVRIQSAYWGQNVYGAEGEGAQGAQDL